MHTRDCHVSSTNSATVTVAFRASRACLVKATLRFDCPWPTPISLRNSANACTVVTSVRSTCWEDSLPFTLPGTDSAFNSARAAGVERSATGLRRRARIDDGEDEFTAAVLLLALSTPQRKPSD